MNTLNPSAVVSSGCNLRLLPSLDRHRSSPAKTISFRNAKPPFLVRSFLNQNRTPNSNGERPGSFQFHEFGAEVSQSPLWSCLKTALVTTIAGTAIFFSRFYLNAKPAIAAPISPATDSQASDRNSILEGEKERLIEEHLISYPRDVEGLKELMEIKIKAKKIPEAVEILDRLIELEPDETEWPMMKSHVYAVGGEFEAAKDGFNELIKKDPLCMEAYHGLVTVASQEESLEDLKVIEGKVEEALKVCKKEKKGSEMRDFKLLIAQIKVLESEYDSAFKVYQELVKEEPRDVRPYLCQGILYTLLRKNREADKCFQKYRRLVPKEHPYASYFDGNMLASKAFALKMENERAMAKN